MRQTITQMKTQTTATDKKGDENVSLGELKHKDMLNDNISNVEKCPF